MRITEVFPSSNSLEKTVGFVVILGLLILPGTLFCVCNRSFIFLFYKIISILDCDDDCMR